MKKNLLVALAAGMMLPLGAQWTQVGGTVTVEENTLKYVSGTHDVKGTSVETNYGNVNVRGDFGVEATATFTNKFDETNPTNYGQLIISDQSAATGSVIGEFETPGSDIFYVQSLAVPYTGVTASALADMAGIAGEDWQNHTKDGVFSNTRYQNPVWHHENTKYSVDDMASAETITTGSTTFSPADYYGVNNGYEGLSVRMSEYYGQPANVAHSVDVTAYTIDRGSETVVNNYSRNQFGEMIGTYLTDLTAMMPTGWNTPGRVEKGTYGDNLYLYGNPYTSNMNLNSNLPTDGKVTHVLQFGGATISDGGNDGSISSTTKPFRYAILIGGSWMNETDALEVRPFHTYEIKTDGSTFSYTLNEANKTFDIDAQALTFDTGRSSYSEVYYIKLDLYDQWGRNVGTDCTVAAAAEYDAANVAGNQVYWGPYLPESKDGLYTLDENADGSVVSYQAVRFNGVNTFEYVGLPIAVGHQVSNLYDGGAYSIQMNKFSDSLLDGVNVFYFEDKETGFITEITEDFVYDFNATESSTDRFVIYWNELPETLSVTDVRLSQTKVYKDSDDFKVRFSTEWRTADVFVYNMLGQLVHSAKNVNTAVDYTLPLAENNAAAYVVKTVGDNGEIKTDKIVKK